MNGARSIRVFYHRQLLDRARAGDHNYTNRLRVAVERCGWSIDLHADTETARIASAAAPGYSLFHMAPPLGPRCLNTRLAYAFPFWRIEQTDKRWEFDVARAEFDPDRVDPALAATFCKRRRHQHVPGIRADGDRVFVPLQGHIRRRRSFQTMSSLDMIRHTLDHTGAAPVVASLHPNETYAAPDLTALDALADRDPRLTVTRKPMSTILPQTACIVTQNSSVALFGYLLGIPAILFGQIDFHHIALNVSRLGVAECFARLPDHRPDYDRYLYWFWRMTAINAAADDADDQILAAFRHHGWPL